jgi:excisionase family DNA binding protein
MTLDATHDSETIVLTIGDAAKVLSCSIRTVQRRLDANDGTGDGILLPVQAAGKRCVQMPSSLVTKTAAKVQQSLQPVVLDVLALNSDVSHDSGHDKQGDSTALARLPQDGRGAALIAAIVRETLNQAEERKAAPDASHVAAKLLLTLSECQTLTGLSRAVLREAIETKKLKAKLIGRSFRIKRPDLEAFVKAL